MGEEDRLYGMTSDATIEIEAADPTYAVKVGSRLRAIRKQKRLSLQEVEASSGQEFKASVLGAYERGERAISVPRLQRLADFYSVPVDQLLPRDPGGALAARGASATEAGGQETEETFTTNGGTEEREDRVTIDLAALDTSNAPESDLLRRYLGMIAVQREDFNGRIITIRGEDVRALALLFSTNADILRHRLDDLGLRQYS